MWIYGGGIFCAIKSDGELKKRYKISWGLETKMVLTRLWVNELIRAL